MGGIRALFVSFLMKLCVVQYAVGVPNFSALGRVTWFFILQLISKYSISVCKQGSMSNITLHETHALGIFGSKYHVVQKIGSEQCLQTIGSACIEYVQQHNLQISRVNITAPNHYYTQKCKAFKNQNKKNVDGKQFIDHRMISSISSLARLCVIAQKNIYNFRSLSVYKRHIR